MFFCDRFFLELILCVQKMASVRASSGVGFSSTAAPKSSASDPDQLKSAREDIKELLKSKFCHPILVIFSPEIRFLVCICLCFQAVQIYFRFNAMCRWISRWLRLIKKKKISRWFEFELLLHTVLFVFLPFLGMNVHAIFVSENVFNICCLRYPRNSCISGPHP